MAPTPGAQLGPYDIVAPLGAGGMGEVYEAIDPRLRRRVALKVLPAAMAADPANRDRFEREAQAIAALTHPNIVTIYSVEEAEGVPFLTMELVDGQPLSALIPPGGLPIDRLLQLALPVADAMSAAHTRGITHRDLKPANVMVTTDGRVKVLDFGLAKLKEDTAPTAAGLSMLPTRPLTGDGHIVGTVAYMAPEQAEGKAADPRADIFALGVILYELATGERPFRGDSTASVLSSLLRDTPTLVTERRPELPPELARVIRRCLEKDPARRLQTALDLRNELEEIKASSVPSAGATSSPMPAASSTATGAAPLPASDTALLSAMVRRRRSLVIGVGGLMLVVVVAAVAWRWWPQESGTGPIDSVAVIPFVNASGSPDADYLSDGVTETLTNSLAQIRSLRVVPRTLAAKYKDKPIDPQQVGRELNVRAVVTGQIVQRGDRLRVQAELIDVSNVAQLWGEQFDRTLSEALSMQAEISKSIAEKLRVRLTNEDERGMTAGTNDAEAYQFYLKGRHEWNKRSADGFKKATEYFDRAIQRDPSYALAYTGLAGVYNSSGLYGYLPPKDAFPKAIIAAQKAIELNDRLSDAHAARAFSSLYGEWNWSQSEREFRRALALDPDNALAHSWYGGLFLRSLGRFDEALAERKRAEALDPTSPVLSLGLGQDFITARRYDEAIAALKRALELEPGLVVAHNDLAEAYMLSGKGDLAIQEGRRALELGTPGARARLATGYVVAGKKAEAMDMLRKAVDEARQTSGSATYLAETFAVLGDTRQAFEFLERAYSDREPLLILLNVQPEFDSLRADPRFSDLVRRVGIPSR